MAALFRDLCLGNRTALLEILNTRTVQTNEVGRSAILGPALTYAAPNGPVQLIDVGCSAGLNMLCDRYRLDYGVHGVTGPDDSPVHVDCRVVAGSPPVARELPIIAGSGGHRPQPPRSHRSRRRSLAVGLCMARDRPIPAGGPGDRVGEIQPATGASG